LISGGAESAAKIKKFSCEGEGKTLNLQNFPQTLVDSAPLIDFFRSHKSCHLLLSGFEKAQRLLAIGGGCLLIVFIFGIILCRLDISAGRSK